MSDCPTKHATLMRIEGPLHPSGKDYLCTDCGEIVEVEIKPSTIGVVYGQPGK